MFSYIGSLWVGFISLVIGYFIGSISFAVLICKSKGVDIFKEGSGNPGATNVKRVLGRFWGNTVFAFDCLKGVLAAIWPLYVFEDPYYMQMWAVCSYVGSVLGHNFSIFLKLRGGKGVATTVGGLLILMPLELVVGIIVWIVTFFSARYVSLASILLGVSLPISAYFLQGISLFFWLATVLMGLILIRHRSNIVRLIRGQEKRFDQKKKS